MLYDLSMVSAWSAGLYDRVWSQPGVLVLYDLSMVTAWSAGVI